MLKQIIKKVLPIILIAVMVAVAFYQTHQQGEIRGKLDSIQAIYQEGFSAGQTQVYNKIVTDLQEQGFLKIIYQSTIEGEEDQVIILMPFQSTTTTQ